MKKRDSQKGSFLGPRFSNDQIANFLAEMGAPHERFASEAELLETVAKLMAEGKIVGWFHGRMEFGPRALGARSIIGDARNAAMQANMNLKIKFRESFRPSALCALRSAGARARLFSNASRPGKPLHAAGGARSGRRSQEGVRDD